MLRWLFFLIIIWLTGALYLLTRMPAPKTKRLLRPRRPQPVYVSNKTSHNIMVGIPSVYRKNGFKYLTEAVSSLLIYFSTSQIIVFNADEKKTMPPKWIKDVHVIHRKNKLTIDTQYPLPEHHDAQTIQAATDNDMRKIWRMKEALDYIYIAEYMIQFKSNWTVIVQDDAVMNDFSFLKKTFPSKIFS